MEYTSNENFEIVLSYLPLLIHANIHLLSHLYFPQSLSRIPQEKLSLLLVEIPISIQLSNLKSAGGCKRWYDREQPWAFHFCVDPDPFGVDWQKKKISPNSETMVGGGALGTEPFLRHRVLWPKSRAECTSKPLNSRLHNCQSGKSGNDKGLELETIRSKDFSIGGLWQAWVNLESDKNTRKILYFIIRCKGKNISIWFKMSACK